jgi:hypothetical protein
MTTQPGPDIPLRLELAVEIAFPFGGMTVSGRRTKPAPLIGKRLHRLWQSKPAFEQFFAGEPVHSNFARLLDLT